MPFGIEVNGQPIASQTFPRALTTGISFRPILQGLVPEIEEREAARFNGYTWRSWLELDYEDRVSGAAYFRATRLLELVRGEAETAEIERRQLTAAARR